MILGHNKPPALYSGYATPTVLASEPQEGADSSMVWYYLTLVAPLPLGNA